MALEAAIQRWTTAVNARDADTLAATMTADVELLDANATATGREAALRALREPATSGKLLATSREITISGDVAWHIVGLALRQRDGDVQAAGQALEIWKRVNGRWLLHRRVAARTVGPDDLLTRPSTKEPVLDQPGN